MQISQENQTLRSEGFLVQAFLMKNFHPTNLLNKEQFVRKMKYKHFR